jgi:hypothetical protein
MRLVAQGGGGDEGILIGGAVRIIHGQVFARDFFEVVGPGTFYWLALFFKLFGVTFLVTRVCLFLTSLATALLIYYLSGRVCRRYQVLPALLVFGTYFSGLWPTISHHVDSNFLGLLAFTFMVLWQDSRKSSLLLCAGASAGVTTFFLQPKGMLLLVAFMVWLWIQHKRREASISTMGLVVASYCSVIVIVLGYFWSWHALWDLAYTNVFWPARHYSAVNVVPYAQGIISDYWNVFVIAKSGLHWTIIIGVVLIPPFILVAALPALLPAVAVRFRKDTTGSAISLYWLSGWALWLSEFHHKDFTHLAFGSPLLIILCVYYLEQYRAKVADLILQALAISAACLLAFNLFLVLSARSTATRVGSVAMFRSDPALTALDKIVSPGQEIFAYPYIPMYYFLSATTNPTRYAALMYHFNTPSQFEEVLQILEQRHVRYVVWNTGFQENPRTFFPGMKRVSRDELIVEPYLESHYNVVWADANYRIMERKAENYAN